MSWEAWLTIVVVVAAVVVLAREIAPPGVSLLGGVVVLLVAGVIEPEVAFAGFSNPAPITVAALYVVAAAVEKTGVHAPKVDGAHGSRGRERTALARHLPPAAASSAILNNTPIVAMLVPPVSRWANRRGVSVSRLLMPLSYAAILGGMLTVIGTSTNIVVSGLLEEGGLEPLGFFEIGAVGLPVAVVGLAYLLLFAPDVLPDRRPARSDLEGDVREFAIDMIVVPGGPLDGVEVEEGGLRHLSGVFLVAIDRDDRPIAPVGPTAELRGGDRLRFVGRSTDVVDLQRMRGLEPAAGEHLAGFDTDRLAFFEAVIGPTSPLVGTSLKEIGFRSRYQAAVVAVHRADQRMPGKLGEVRLRVGDTLLLVATPQFGGRWGDRSDFLLVSRLGDTDPIRPDRGGLAVVVVAGVVALAATGTLGILEASLVGAFATVATGTLAPREAATAVDLDVIVVIAASFGLGGAVVATGVAQDVAGGLVDLLGGWGDRAVLAAVLVATVVLTEVVTNNAAAVLMFPVAVVAAGEVGADPRSFVIVVALAASASFLTPIGYQTNTMVWGPGGYRFTDYARLGAPLTVVTAGVAVALAPVFFG
ncbi:MAG: SLC13 family permease [Acidimicrobiia bacterium]|nr:SLC13 family permease [Acidimicrobiia bacterium]